MNGLPTLSITTTAYIQKNAEKGSLINNYVPFKNLVDDLGVINDFKTSKLQIDINTPINIEIQDSFDGSVNLILNNDKEQPKLINSRFSVEEGNTFSIPDHKGNRDSNLYEDLQLNLDTRLYKTINKIPTLTFNGLSESGKMKCGSYHFYFKLADNDGNETDFISESGLVVCHIGNYKDPGSVRMGMVDENAGKSISFTLSNLDSSYDFIKVYYTRTTSDNSQQDVITAHYIDSKFPINGESFNLSITGTEIHNDIALSEINILYELVNTVKSQAQVQGMMFFGNVNKVTIPYNILEKESLNFLPSIVQSNSIGNLDNNYLDISGRESYEYYNPYNLYYNLGYWPEEYYRFGIVYILNDYTLSPVFNTRGLDLSETTAYTEIPHIPTPTLINPQINEDGFIEQGKLVFENAKGIVKIPKLINLGTTGTPIWTSIITPNGVKPWGIQFTNSNITKLKEYTKGFFIVRQERTPTIYAQGLSIAKTKNDYGNIPVVTKNTGYFTQSFLKSDRNLGEEFINITPSKLDKKAAIVPEAEIRAPLFNQLFTSSEYKISYVTTPSVSIILEQSGNNFYLKDSIATNNSKDLLTHKLTMINDGVVLTTNGDDYFSARAGEAEEAWQNINVSSLWTTIGTENKVNTALTESTNLVRGLFGTYVGMDKELPFGTIFNIRPNDYSEEKNYILTMFKTRMDSSEPYMAASDRISWESFSTYINTYRGDCFIGNFSHRMHRNFIDPNLPTNTKIIDKKTWAKNYVVWADQTANTQEGNVGINRVISSFALKKGESFGALPTIDNTNLAADEPPRESLGTLFKSITTGINDFFADNTDIIQVRGLDKINRADVNAVPLGHWVTFKVMSNINLSMRDIDFNNPAEEAIHGKKRGFYPLQAMDPNDSLSESNIINGGANVTLSKRHNFIVPDVPFIKNYFGNRILYSDIATTDAFKNGYRVFSAGHYRDYTKTYGSIVDMKEWYGNLFVTMEHGCLLIPVNERAIAGEGQGGNVYINTSNVLPENSKVISDLFGSTWQESVIKTKTGIYGIDTVAKKIWKAAPNEGGSMSLECISDLKVQRFLNENIDLKESDKLFYSKTKEWNLCYNENLEKFITYYSWTPSHSANINNVFFSLDKKVSKNIYDNLVINATVNESSNLYGFGNRSTKQLIAGKKYTFSFNGNILNATANRNLLCQIYIGDQYISESLTTTDNSTKSLTFTSPITGIGYLNAHYYPSIPENTSGSVHLNWYKVEEGEIATSYDPVKLWKHGQSGIYDNQGKIFPTNWYGNQEPFSFEFVVTENPSIQKIYNNLKLISNKAEPSSFEFEVVGEGYEWFDYKDIIVWIDTNKVPLGVLAGSNGETDPLRKAYKYVLGKTQGDLKALTTTTSFPALFNKPDDYKIPKLPYIPRKRYVNPTDVAYSIGKDNYELNTSNTSLVTDNLLSEDKVHTIVGI